MHPIDPLRLAWTRRRFFARSASTLCGALGGASLASLLGGGGGGGEAKLRAPGPHFALKCKRVIHLHMEGGPSQLDLFDYKPQLRRRYDQDLPESIRSGQRLTGMTSGQARFPVAPSL